MYLSHIFALGIARQLWPRLGLGSDSLPAAIAFTVFMLAAVIATAVLVYRTVEKPITDFLHGLQSGPPGRRAA
jgi:peptidoglycan/LPS O-acetylase OafA/YrhL